MGSSYFVTFGTDRLTFGGSGSVAWEAPTYIYKELWSTTNPFRNSYSITLSDSLYNYDEYIVYGSASRTPGPLGLDVSNRYVVVPDKVNFGGCYYAGRWSTDSTFILINGTEMWLSGTSGYVQSSYFIGQGNNTTAWGQGTYTGRQFDVHPYRIVGVKEVK